MNAHSPRLWEKQRAPLGPTALAMDTRESLGRKDQGPSPVHCSIAMPTLTSESALP